MKLGNDYLFTTKVATYDFVEQQLLVTDDLDYYMDGLGLSGHKGCKAFSYGEQSGGRTTHRIMLQHKWLYHHYVMHEIEHAKNYALWCAGVACSRKNDEADAYLVDWLATWIYRKLARAGIKVKTIGNV